MAEKWSINQLHLETGLDRRTIQGLLSGAEAAETKENGDKLFWLRDLVAGLRRKQDANNAALVAAQTRFTDTKADIAEVDRARARGEIIEVSVVEQVWSNHILAARRIVTSSKLTVEEQDEILNELESFRVADLFNEGELSAAPVDLPALPPA